MNKLTDAQAAEIAKYDVTYQALNYRMSAPRFSACAAVLAELPRRLGYLDVSCGRGEMLKEARRLGFYPVWGTEVVDTLVGDEDGMRVARALAWRLPWPNRIFEVVSMFDVIEHLLPGDDERACRELARVASDYVLITANNLPSVYDGVELHVNRRPYEEWDALFRAWFPGKVEWLKGRQAKGSEMWRIALKG